MTDDRISAVVVGYSDPQAATRAILSLRDQSHPPDEILVVDNDIRRSISGEIERQGLAGCTRIVAAGENLGYTRAVNLAGRRARGDWLFFLNPDAVAEPGCLASLLAAGAEDDVAVVGAQVLLPDGRVNAGENPINLAGLSWSGGYGSRREHAAARDTAGVSGAALMVRRHAFAELGGLCPDFFLYQDDADLCWRARLAGWRVRYCPEAAVTHDFEFQRGDGKWFYLERNREWALLSNLSVSTLVLLAPLLVGTEVAVAARAAGEGWLRAKVDAWWSVARNARRIALWRRFVQSRRRVPDSVVLRRFRGGMETSLIESALLTRMNPVLEGYRRLVLGLLARSRG